MASPFERAFNPAFQQASAAVMKELADEKNEQRLNERIALATAESKAAVIAGQDWHAQERENKQKYDEKQHLIGLARKSNNEAEAQRIASLAPTEINEALVLSQNQFEIGRQLWINQYTRDGKGKLPSSFELAPEGAPEGGYPSSTKFGFAQARQQSIDYHFAQQQAAIAGVNARQAGDEYEARKIRESALNLYRELHGANPEITITPEALNNKNSTALWKQTQSLTDKYADDRVTSAYIAMFKPLAGEDIGTVDQQKARIGISISGLQLDAAQKRTFEQNKATLDALEIPRINFTQQQAALAVARAETAIHTNAVIVRNTLMELSSKPFTEAKAATTYLNEAMKHIPNEEKQYWNNRFKADGSVVVAEELRGSLGFRVKEIGKDRQGNPIYGERWTTFPLDLDFKPAESGMPITPPTPPVTVDPATGERSVVSKEQVDAFNKAKAYKNAFDKAAAAQAATAAQAAATAATAKADKATKDADAAAAAAKQVLIDAQANKLSEAQKVITKRIHANNLSKVQMEIYLDIFNRNNVNPGDVVGSMEEEGQRLNTENVEKALDATTRIKFLITAQELRRKRFWGLADRQVSENTEKEIAAKIEVLRKQLAAATVIKDNAIADGVALENNKSIPAHRRAKKP